MIIEDTTPIAALTVADLKTLLKDYLREQKNAAIPPLPQQGSATSMDSKESRISLVSAT